MIMAIFIPIPEPEEALSLSMPNVLFIFSLNILLMVHFSASVQEWPHHDSYEFSQTFRWNRTVYV